MLVYDMMCLTTESFGVVNVAKGSECSALHRLHAVFTNSSLIKPGLQVLSKSKL